MSFVTVHYDDSGTHTQASTAIAACFVSTVEQWKEFDRNWKEVEADEQFCTFHMADFAANQGQFKNWDKRKMKRVLTRLCGLIITRARAGYAHSVTKKDYDEVITGPFREYAGRFHYTFVARQCAGLVSIWRRKWEPNSSMRYVFDRMGKGKGEIDLVMERALASSEREAKTTGVAPLTGWSFESKSVIVPLQAADIGAWTAFQMMQRAITGRATKTQWITDMAYSLLKAKFQINFFTKDGLTRWSQAEQNALIGIYDRLPKEAVII
ncbi:MAG TPA: hypothetical protein VGQ12_18240 [Candidatus Angelobacter sp.]|jgi:hypothetical protein|nr:hypothetical protein [Candidatus Angelobacter sp.]